MAERVTTGGLKTFTYQKGKQPRLDEERKKSIREGYEKYYQRKAKEKKRRNAVIGIILLLILLVILTIILKT